MYIIKTRSVADVLMESTAREAQNTANQLQRDGEDFISTEQTVAKTILHITVSHKIAVEMAEQYWFTPQQTALLDELLSEQ